MPNLPELYIQEPMALYPVVEELDASLGVVNLDLSNLPMVDPEKRITLARLAGLYGNRLGPTDGVNSKNDILLEAHEADFAYALPSSIKRGLYIERWDSRYKYSRTEQLVRVSAEGYGKQPGVVFPAEEFHVVARSAPDLAVHTMAKTRKSQATNLDRVEADGSVGRSAGHAMVTKIQGLNTLENKLLDERNKLLIPLHRETASPWISHFKAKNLNKKRRQLDEQLHTMLETASISTNLGSTAVKAAHRALTSNLYRRGSARELNSQWRQYIELAGHYVVARLAKVDASRIECRKQLEIYQPFLDAKPKPKAA